MWPFKSKRVDFEAIVSIPNIPARVPCATCGGIFTANKLKRAWVINLPQEERDFPTTHSEDYCSRCFPQTDYKIQLVSTVVEDSRNFTVGEGWLQEVDDEGNHLVVITPEQQSLIYFDCGCEIQKRGQTKCPECEKPKKR